MIVDGRSIAASILAKTKERAEKLACVPVVRAITCDPSPATLSYLKIKALRATDAGMILEVVELPASSTEEECIEAIKAPGAHAVIVQLPLPPGLSTERVVNAIPQMKDADVLSSIAYEDFLSGNNALLPPVVEAVKEILLRTSTELSGKHAVVVGQGKLVGLPVAAWLTRMNASVAVVTKETPEDELRVLLKSADIVVSGAGSPSIIAPDSIQEGVCIIDAGTSESDGQMVGDADPACATKASVFTPVPGGVGPIAVACLFRNVVELLERSLQES